MPTAPSTAKSTARRRRRRLAPALALAVGALAAAGCEDPFAGLRQPVPEVPSEATIVDFREGPFREPSAFDFVFLQRVRVDLSPNWDVLFEIDESGDPRLLPFGAVAEEDSEAGLQVVDETFEGLTEVPSDGYVQEEPVPIGEGDVLAVVSRTDPGSGFLCRHFAKVEILEIDFDERSLTFRYLVNPNCETREIVPGEPGEAG